MGTTAQPLPEPTISVRLQGGTNDIEGQVEVLYQGTWGGVCDTAWGLEEAEVACKQVDLP